MRLDVWARLMKYLLIPIETKVREFNAKILLSCIAVESGFEVIISEQNNIVWQLKYLPRGIYIDKSVASTKNKKFRLMQSLGNRVVAWCEEGLVYRNRDAYLRERISLDSFEQVARFFAWGNVQREAVAIKVGKNEDQIVVTGNPRFDILRPEFRGIFEEEAKRISSQYGSYILINTNFSRFNHFHGSEYVVDTLRKRGTIRNRNEEEFFYKWSEYLGKVFGHFKELLPALSKCFPFHKIILRPHPSENIGVWKEISKELGNVHVVHEGNVIPWLMASDVVIHNSCTTGVEAFLLDKPTIAYMPVTSNDFDSYLPNAVSSRIFSQEELLECVDRHINLSTADSLMDQNLSERLNILHQYVANLEGPLASEKIIDELNQLKFDYELKPNAILRQLIWNLEWSWRPVKAALRRLIMGSTGGTVYQRQKFSGMDLEEIKKSLQRLHDTSGRFASVKVYPYGKACFLLTRA